MVCYKIVFSRKALKELKSLPKNIVKEIAKQVNTLAKNPLLSGCKKLKGSADAEYRIKVKRDYRILYTIDFKEKVIDVSRIRHRKEVYR